MTNYTLSPLLELSKFIAVEQLQEEDDYPSSYHLHCNLNERTPIEIAAQRDLQQLGIERLLFRKEKVSQMFHLHKLDYSSVLWLSLIHI